MFTLEGAEPTAINAPLSSVGVNSLESDLNNTGKVAKIIAANINIHLRFTITKSSTYA